MKISPVKSALLGGICWIIAGCLLHPLPVDLKWGIWLFLLAITTSQLGLSHIPEVLAALITSIAGLMTAGLHFVLAFRSSLPRNARRCWFIAAMALSFSMVLSALYGARFYLQIAWLDIPWMRALHGSANALGFGGAGMIGWYLASRK